MSYNPKHGVEAARLASMTERELVHEQIMLLREIRNLLLEDSLGPVQEAGGHDPADIDRIGAGAKGRHWPAVPE